MITPRTTHVAGARADFNELTLLDDLDVHWTAHAHVSVRLWRAPDGSAVAHFCIGVPLNVVDAPKIARAQELPMKLHMIVSAPSYEDGFDDALDAAFNREATVTLLEQPTVHPEVAAVPKPEPAPAVTGPITVTERDFDFLTGTSFRFDFEHFRDVLETYAPGKSGPDAEVDPHWQMVYCMDREGSSYADIMLATAFLTGNGHAYELASAPTEDGPSEWWLLTDFKNANWRRSDEQEKVEERLKREEAEASGDELMQAYLLPAAEKKGDAQ